MSGPRRRQDFRPEDLALATSLCLDVATRLGDFLEEMVVIGGLVPSLLIGAPAPQLSIEAHIGTTDVDLGLTIRVLTAERYKTIAERLRRTGFEPDRTTDGRITRQRWRLAEHPRVTMDFLIAPANPQATAGSVQSFLPDFGAFITPGLELAFIDFRPVELSGRTLRREVVRRTIRVCEAGAYVILKSLAFRNRAEDKDAYDLDWILRAYPGSVESVAKRLWRLPDTREKRLGLQYLQDDFKGLDSLGPMAVARFLNRADDDAFRVDVSGRARSLLGFVRQPPDDEAGATEASQRL